MQCSASAGHLCKGGESCPPPHTSCNLLEMEVLPDGESSPPHLWTSHGTDTQRSLWDQCIPLSLKTAALPTLGLQAPADGSCCGSLSAVCLRGALNTFSLTSLGRHLTALHIMFSYFRKLRIQEAGSNQGNQTSQTHRPFFANVEMLFHLPSLSE